MTTRVENSRTKASAMRGSRVGISSVSEAGNRRIGVREAGLYPMSSLYAAQCSAVASPWTPRPPDSARSVRQGSTTTTSFEPALKPQELRLFTRT